MSVTAVIEKKMADLYLMFCMPRIILNTETGKVDITYVWTNDEVRQLYEQLQKELILHYEELRKKQAVEQRLQADVLVRCVHCNALIETDVHCDNCGSFHPTRR